MVGEKKEQAKGAREDELWVLAFKRLVPWTMKKHRLSPADAEEIVQEAIRLFLEAGGDADPADLKALLQALGSNINGIAVNRRRKKALRAVTLTTDGSPAELDDPPDAEQKIIGDRINRKGISAILDRIADDELLFSIVTQMAEGVVEPAGQAKALSRDIREVYNARRRLKTHTEEVKKLMETW